MNGDVAVKARYSLRGVERPYQTLGVLAALRVGYSLTTAGVFWVLMPVLFLSTGGWGRRRPA
jgi:hypothetical protein